jgi:hypothetical protein
MSISNHHHKTGIVYMFSSSKQPNLARPIIKIDIDEMIEPEVKIVLPSMCGENGHYLQAGGKCDEYYHPVECEIVDDIITTKPGLTPISNDIITVNDKIYKYDNVVKPYTIDKQMVTFVKGIVEINNSIAILYCNTLNQLMLIKNKVEYLIANEANNTHSTILVGSAGNLMIGNVFKGNLYHHYYLKGKFYEVPIDMTHDNEKFIAHLTKDGFPCYIYTRYGEIDQVTISYSSDINGENNWSIRVIHTRPSYNLGYDGYFRSYSLLNTYDGKLYLAESCREKYFSISSCTDITKDDWLKDIVYETGFENYNLFNDRRNFIIDNKVYLINGGIGPSLGINANVLDIDGSVMLADDGYLYHFDDEYVLIKSALLSTNIIYGSMVSLPNGDIMVLIIDDISSIKVHRIKSCFKNIMATKSDVMLI